MSENYKAVIDDLVNNRVEFDDGIHGSDLQLLRAMAVGGYRSFKKIPERYLSPELIDLAAQDLCELMGEKDCYVPGCYETTALNLLARKVDMHSLHRDLLTKKIIDTCLEMNPYKTVGRRKKIGALGASFIDPKALGKAVEAKIAVLTILDASEIASLTDDNLAASIRNDPSQGRHLQRIGRRDILIQEISKGLWCNQTSWECPVDVDIKGHPRPPTLADAVAARMRIDEQNLIDILYHDCFVAGFPIQEVRPLIKSRAEREWLIELYPRDDLLKAFKYDRQMKGLLLEQELGM